MPDLSPADAQRVAVVIPALNEEASLPLVLADLPSVGQVVVVDNGSTDATAQRAAEAGADVVHEGRRGYGSACLAGLEWLRSGGLPPEIVVFLDADHSDDPTQLPELVSPILSGECDLVLGSRMTGKREPGAMPAQSVWGNRFACLLMRLLLGARYTDLGPFRAARWESLESLGMSDTNYGWTVEMQIKALRAGLRVREVPTPYRRRVGQSKISGTITGSVKAGAKILWLVARYGVFDPWRPARD
ncbi:MAG: glycosyltransferase family 2 protein [Planctomycetota bacterium]